MVETASYTVLEVRHRAGVATILLNRPASYNALNEALKDELLDALKRAARDPGVRCVVLSGAGKAFCSGQDLKEITPDHIGTIGDSLRRTYNPIVMLLRTMEKPVIAAVNGVAAGAGCSLALACDLRLVAASASFRLAFSNIGLVPDSGACYTLPHLVGYGIALELAFTGRAVDAQEALRIGLANRVVQDDELATVTAEFATSLAARPTKALGLTKRAMNRTLSLDLEGALEYEAGMQEIAARTHDFREGVEAFREKRSAHFEGR